MADDQLVISRAKALVAGHRQRFQHSECGPRPSAASPAAEALTLRRQLRRTAAELREAHKIGAQACIRSERLRATRISPQATPGCASPLDLEWSRSAKRADPADIRRQAIRVSPPATPNDGSPLDSERNCSTEQEELAKIRRQTGLEISKLSALLGEAKTAARVAHESAANMARERDNAVAARRGLEHELENLKTLCAEDRRLRNLATTKLKEAESARDASVANEARLARRVQMDDEALLEARALIERQRRTLEELVASSDDGAAQLAEAQSARTEAEQRCSALERALAAADSEAVLVDNATAVAADAARRSDLARACVSELTERAVACEREVEALRDGIADESARGLLESLQVVMGEVKGTPWLFPLTPKGLVPVCAVLEQLGSRIAKASGAAQVTHGSGDAFPEGKGGGGGAAKAILLSESEAVVTVFREANSLLLTEVMKMARRARRAERSASEMSDLPLQTGAVHTTDDESLQRWLWRTSASVSNLEKAMLPREASAIAAALRKLVVCMDQPSFSRAIRAALVAYACSDSDGLRVVEGADGGNGAKRPASLVTELTAIVHNTPLLLGLARAAATKQRRRRKMNGSSGGVVKKVVSEHEGIAGVGGVRRHRVREHLTKQKEMRAVKRRAESIARSAADSKLRLRRFRLCQAQRRHRTSGAFTTSFSSGRIGGSPMKIDFSRHEIGRPTMSSKNQSREEGKANPWLSRSFAQVSRGSSVANEFGPSLTRDKLVQRSESPASLPTGQAQVSAPRQPQSTALKTPTLETAETPTFGSSHAQPLSGRNTQSRRGRPLSASSHQPNMRPESGNEGSNLDATVADLAWQETTSALAEDISSLRQQVQSRSKRQQQQWLREREARTCAMQELSALKKKYQGVIADMHLTTRHATARAVSLQRQLQAVKVSTSTELKPVSMSTRRHRSRRCRNLSTTESKTRRSTRNLQRKHSARSTGSSSKLLYAGSIPKNTVAKRKKTRRRRRGSSSAQLQAVKSSANHGSQRGKADQQSGDGEASEHDRCERDEGIQKDVNATTSSAHRGGVPMQALDGGKSEPDSTEQTTVVLEQLLLRSRFDENGTTQQRVDNVPIEILMVQGEMAPMHLQQDDVARGAAGLGDDSKGPAQGVAPVEMEGEELEKREEEDTMVSEIPMFASDDDACDHGDQRPEALPTVAVGDVAKCIENHRTDSSVLRDESNVTFEAPLQSRLTGVVAAPSPSAGLDYDPSAANHSAPMPRSPLSSILKSSLSGAISTPSPGFKLEPANAPVVSAARIREQLQRQRATRSSGDPGLSPGSQGIRDHILRSGSGLTSGCTLMPEEDSVHYLRRKASNYRVAVNGQSDDEDEDEDANGDFGAASDCFEAPTPSRQSLVKTSSRYIATTTAAAVEDFTRRRRDSLTQWSHKDGSSPNMAGVARSVYGVASAKTFAHLIKNDIKRWDETVEGLDCLLAS